MRNVRINPEEKTRPGTHAPDAGGLTRHKPINDRVAGEVPPAVREVLRAPSQALDVATRSFMESRFGHDFGEVRVHTDRRAAAAAQAANARAYTLGRDVVFGAGQYAPGSDAGRKLMAHELTHVVQQQRFPDRHGAPAVSGDKTQPDEVEANELSTQVISSGPGEVASRIRAQPSAPMQRLALEPDEPATAYLPDPSELETRFTAMDAAAREAFISGYLTKVKAKWARANAAGLTAKLDKVRTAETAMAKSATKPVPGLPKNAPSAYREYLMPDAGGVASTDLGHKLVTGKTAVSAVTGTPALAVDAIMNLRRLDDVLTRILSAQAAASATGTPLAGVLAMYRTEGDLNAPPSSASLAEGIPSGTRDATTSLNPKPDISHLVWLGNPAFVGAATDEEIREFALSEWFVQVGGLDAVGKLTMPRALPFWTWSAGNWLAATGRMPGGVPSPADVRIRDDAELAAKDRWDKLFANTEISKPLSESGASSAVMVTPKDPEVMVAGILAEAVMLQRALGKASSLLGSAPAGAGASAEMSAGMSYLHYHAGPEQMKQILVSAAIAASGTTGATYAGLRKSMAGTLDVAALRAKMKLFDDNARRLGTPLSAAEKATLEAENAALVSDMWSALSTWLLAEASRLTLLGQFVEKADTSVWSAWREHRGNLSRYNVLRAYYAML